MYYSSVARRAISDTWRVLRERTGEEVLIATAGAASGAVRFLSTTGGGLSLEATLPLLGDAATGALIFGGVAAILVAVSQLVLAPVRLARDQRAELSMLAHEHERQLLGREAKISELVDEVGRLRSDFLLAFARDQLKRRYGEASRRRPVDKMTELRQLLSAREEEIERGDYSRAAEIIDIIRYYEPTVERWLKGKGGYEPEMERIRRLEVMVERFFAETPNTTRITRPPEGD